MTATSKNSIILGIDPGFATTGFAFITETNKQIEVLDYGVITTATGQEFSERLKSLHLHLTALIKKYQPGVVAVEKLFFSKNVKTALDVAQARGVILLTAIQADLPLFEFTPLQVKQAICGYGRAEKCQIQNMVKNILHLTKIPKPDDAADALAVALTYWQSKIFLEKTKT